MKRGDIVTVSASGDYGKPRPAIIVQSDWLNATDSVLVCLLTSALTDAPLFRLGVEPSRENGLEKPSQIMTDKVLAIPRQKCGPVIGTLDRGTIATLNHMLSIIIGIAD